MQEGKHKYEVTKKSKEESMQDELEIMKKNSEVCKG